MQVRLPEEDQEEILHEASRPETLDARTEEKKVEANTGTTLKYLIIAGLVVLIIILLTSSHQKIKIVNVSTRQARSTQGKSDVKTSKISTLESNIQSVKQKHYSEQEKIKEENDKPLSFHVENNEKSKDQQEKASQDSKSENANREKEETPANQISDREDQIQDYKQHNIEGKQLEKRHNQESPKVTLDPQQKNENSRPLEQIKTDHQVLQESQESQMLKDILQKRKVAQGQRQKANGKVAQLKKDIPLVEPNPSSQTNNEKDQTRKAAIISEAIKLPSYQAQKNTIEKENKQVGQSVLLNKQKPQNRKVDNGEQKQKPQQQPKQVQSDRKDMVTPIVHGSFIVPQFVWTYSEQGQKKTFFVEKCLENIKRFASKSSFEMTVLNSQNYAAFLQPTTAQKVAGLIRLLEERMAKEPSSNLKDHFPTLKKRLIAFHVLSEKGGVFVERNVLLTESLDWLQEIEENVYVNRGSAGARAKYFGFFDLDHGSIPAKHNKRGTNYDTEKYMVVFPCLEPYFLAALANEAFLTETLSEYVQVLTAGKGLEEKLRQAGTDMGALQGKDLYYEAFYASQHLVLRRKQQQIDKSGANSNDDSFAIDHYGLMAINQRYFPTKMDFFFEKHSQEKIYWNLAKYTLQEMQDTTGPMRYITCMMFEQHINYRLEKAREKVQRYYIHPESYLAKYVINNNSQPYILRQVEKSVVNLQGKSWENLPRTIWIYWDKGIENSSLGNKLCVDNIRRTAVHSKFQVKQLNDSNLQKYLGKQLNEKINNFIKNAKIQTYPQTRSDFARIAIIAKYGGIYMDASYFAVDPFQWIINISQAPSEMIFNRYGELPRVLTFIHPHFGNAFDWTYDKQANTKKLMVSAYENNLLIAEANQQIFWDWFEEYGRFITTPYEQTEKEMKDIGVLGDRWTSKDNMYLAAMDSIKNVIAKKNKEILAQIDHDSNYKGPKSAAQFYGIWSISGYRSQQKFRAHTNFDNTYYSKPHNSDNIFLWRYSDNYMRGILGRVNKLVKLYGWNIKYMNNFLLQSYDSNFTSELHPLSYFAKYLYNPYWHKITKNGDQLSLELIKK